VSVTFAGTRDRVESRLVPEAGFELDTFPVSGFPRRPGPALARALARAAVAPLRCRAILRERRPDVVLGGGGYVAGPMVLAARLAGIPAVLTEADAHLGLANRLAAPFARQVFLAYDIEGRTGPKYRVVGRPIPTAHLGATREQGRARFGIDPDVPLVTVYGALAGARSLNEMALKAWGEHGPAVIHLTGERDADQLRGTVSRPDYVMLPSTSHFGELLAATDIAVSRAGGTVWELAAAGTPAILVPYPYATADHQTLNARHFERGGGAVLVPDPEVGSIPGIVEELLADPARLDAMRASMRALARPHAADEIADAVVELARAAR
jgi:UDP-N-acetylglucosamine--N-acetylmuramyl-(pentapeptide) pyrophosphoryl-undecaprenol N-acetylglucosamine transferase